MKRVIYDLLVIAMLVHLSGCSKDNNEGDDGNSDGDADTDTDTDSDTDTNTDSDTETESENGEPSPGNAIRDGGHGLVTDAEGNIFVVGSSEYTWTGPNAEAPVTEHSRVRETLACFWENGCDDAFILKLNPSGEYQWHTFHGKFTHSDEAGDVHLDSQGNLYVLGIALIGWNGPDGEPPLVPHDDSTSQPFLMKLDGDGNYLWHTFFWGEAHEMAIGNEGDLYLIGNASSSMDGPGGAAPLHPFAEGLDDWNYPTNNIQLTKMTGDGTYLWHTYLGGTDADDGNGIRVADNGDLYLAGSSDIGWNGPDGQVPLRPHSSDSGSDTDVMVAKLQSDGTLIWHTFFGGTRDYTDKAEALEIDGEGNVIVSGYAAIEWIGEDLQPPLQDFEKGFVLKLDPDGGYLWHSFPVKAGLADAYIDMNDANSIILASIAADNWLGPNGEAPLHPHSGATTFGSGDIEVVGISADGLYQWHTIYGEYGERDETKAMRVRPDGSVVVAGFSDTPWTGDQDAAPLHSHTGEYDAFILALDSTGGYLWHTFYGFTPSK